MCSIYILTCEVFPLADDAAFCQGSVSAYFAYQLKQMGILFGLNAAVNFYHRHDTLLFQSAFPVCCLFTELVNLVVLFTVLLMALPTPKLVK